MVGHQDVSMDEDSTALVNSFKKPEEASKVSLCQKDRSLLVSPRSDVIKGTLVLDSQRSRHDVSTLTINHVSYQDLTLKTVYRIIPSIISSPISIVHLL